MQVKWKSIGTNATHAIEPEECENWELTVTCDQFGSPRAAIHSIGCSIEEICGDGAFLVTVPMFWAEHLVAGNEIQVELIDERQRQWNFEISLP